MDLLEYQGKQLFARHGVPVPSGAPPAQQLEVVRSGGFAGLRVSGSLDLAADDDRAAEARSLVGRLDFSQVAQRPPRPDRYVYEFLAPDGNRVAVAEQAGKTDGFV